MNRADRVEESRRRFVVKALAAGLYMAGGPLVAPTAVAQILGKVPRKLPPGQSIHDMEGSVLVNGKQATAETVIGPNDLVETGKDGRLVFVVGQDAFIARSNSRVQLSGGRTVIDTLRILTGKLLSVFGKREHRIQTTTATIGIRGTGIYVESEPDQTYACTCYGIADISSVADPTSRETITSEHHDAPRYILGASPEGKRIRPAPFQNHTDLELMLIEELVGRTPPFAVSGRTYSAPRRGY